jgi:hypothetical protein
VRHDFGRLFGRPEERQLLRFQCRRVLLEHDKGLPAPFQLLEKRDNGADDDDPVAVADLGGVERINADTQRHAGMRPAPPGALGERVDRGDTDRAADAVIGQGLARKLGGRAAGELAGERYRLCRTRAAHRLGDRFDRRRTGAGYAVV